jgi:hypothetical protein
VYCLLSCNTYTQLVNCIGTAVPFTAHCPQTVYAVLIYMLTVVTYLRYGEVTIMKLEWFMRFRRCNRWCYLHRIFMPAATLLCATAIESNAPNTCVRDRSSSTLSTSRKNPCNQDPDHLLKRNETGRVRGTNTRPSVLDGLAVAMLASIHLGS